MTRQEHKDILAGLGHLETFNPVDMEAYNKIHEPKTYTFDYNASFKERRLAQEAQAREDEQGDLYV